MFYVDGVFSVNFIKFLKPNMLCKGLLESFFKKSQLPWVVKSGLGGRGVLSSSTCEYYNEIIV